MFYTSRVEIPAKPGSRWLALVVALCALLALKMTRRPRAQAPALEPAPSIAPSMTPRPMSRRIRGDSQELHV